MQIIWLSFAKGNSVSGYAISQRCKEIVLAKFHALWLFSSSLWFLCAFHQKEMIFFIFLLKSAVKCCIGLGMVTLHISGVAVFLLWVDWCLYFDHDEESGILLLKYIFSAANLGQEFSKQTFFRCTWFGLQPWYMGIKRVSVVIRLAWSCNPQGQHARRASWRLLL